MKNLGQVIWRWLEEMNKLINQPCKIYDYVLAGLVLPFFKRYGKDWIYPKH